MKWKFTFDIFNNSVFGVISEMFNVDNGIEEVVFDDNISKHISKWVGIQSGYSNQNFGSVFALASFLGKIDEFLVVDYGFSKHVLLNYFGDFNVDEWKFNVKSGRLPVIRFRVKMWPDGILNVKHGKVTSDDFEGW